MGKLVAIYSASASRAAIVSGLPALSNPWYKRTAMKTKLLSLAAFAGAILSAQNQPVLGEDTVKVSEHVWAIMGWPNIAIIVGGRAALVVDTGLGPRNGATIAR